MRQTSNHGRAQARHEFSPCARRAVITRAADATELAGWQQLTLAAGERASVVGCALTRCDSGCAWTHGHRVVPGSDNLLLRSLPDVGSTAVLEGGPAGAVLSLRALDAPAGAAEPNAARIRVTAYGDAVAAGHATLVPQARLVPPVTPR